MSFSVFSFWRKGYSNKQILEQKNKKQKRRRRSKGDEKAAAPFGYTRRTLDPSSERTLDPGITPELHLTRELVSWSAGVAPWTLPRTSIIGYGQTFPGPVLNRDCCSWVTESVTRKDACLPCCSNESCPPQKMDSPLDGATHPLPENLHRKAHPLLA